MPRPMAAGVLGMARTTALLGGKCFSKLAMDLPAAIDSTTVSGPANRASFGNTSSITCGFTAAMMTAGGGSKTSTTPAAHDAMLGDDLRRLASKIWLLDDNGVGIEPARQPAREHGRAHLTGARQQHRHLATANS